MSAEVSWIPKVLMFFFVLLCSRCAQRILSHHTYPACNIGLRGWGRWRGETRLVEALAAAGLSFQLQNGLVVRAFAGQTEGSHRVVEVPSSRVHSAVVLSFLSVSSSDMSSQDFAFEHATSSGRKDPHDSKPDIEQRERISDQSPHTLHPANTDK